MLKVSISLAAQTDADIDPDSPCIQPVCETLHPQFPTWMIASSSSSSSAFDVLTSPSVDPDRIIFWFDSSLVGAYDKVVISSEWVDPCVRTGVAGCRGSLIKSNQLSGSTSQFDWPYQYKMSASSPCSSVPAATVNPSGETSQHNNPWDFPKFVTTRRLHWAVRQLIIIIWKDAYFWYCVNLNDHPKFWHFHLCLRKWGTCSLLLLRCWQCVTTW